MTQQVRTPWQVTRSVWYALFMREALSRTTADRFAWFWMIIEPAAMIVIMVLIRSVAMGNTHHVGGAEFIPWFIVGLFGFYLYRENMIRLIGAIDSNKALFAYRQVKPIDPVFVRSFVESTLRSFLFLLFIFLGSLIDINLFPSDAIKVLYVWLLIWFLGLGSGLILSALSTMYPEIGRITRIISFPLLLISGVLFPIHYVPQELREILLLNPVAHALEILRGAFFSNYQMISEVSSLYLILSVLVTMLMGLILHIRFEEELKAK